MRSVGRPLIAFPSFGLDDALRLALPRAVPREVSGPSDESSPLPPAADDGRSPPLLSNALEPIPASPPMLPRLGTGTLSGASVGGAAADAPTAASELLSPVEFSSRCASERLVPAGLASIGASVPALFLPPRCLPPSGFIAPALARPATPNAKLEKHANGPDNNTQPAL